MTRLFVYGTLMRGEARASYLCGARFIGEVNTAAEYGLLDLGHYPGLVAGGTTAVAGELYEVDGTTMDALDRLEEHPDLYRRQPISLADGRAAEAYLLAAGDLLARARPIASGDWRRRW